MEEVTSCSVCKLLYEDSRFTDLNGALLENVVKIKLLGDVPIDTAALGLRGGSKICRDCLELVDDIRLGLIKLKDRVLKRNYPHHAQFLLNQQQSGPGFGFGNFKVNRRNSPSSITLCDSAEDGEGTSSSETECSSFCDKNNCNLPGDRFLDRRRSSTSLFADPHLAARVNNERDVRIRVPPSINATFIVMETSNNDDSRCNDSNGQQLNNSPLPKSVQSLLKKNKISDVIESSSFRHACHVDVGAKVQQTENNSTEIAKPPVAEVSQPLVKKENPVPVAREYTHYIKKRRLSYSAGDSSLVSFSQSVRMNNSNQQMSDKSPPIVNSQNTSPVHELNGNSNHSSNPEVAALDLTRPANPGEVLDRSKKDTPPFEKREESRNSCNSVPKQQVQLPVTKPIDRFARLMENGQASPPVLPVRKRRSLGNILEMRARLPTPPPPVPLMPSDLCNGDPENRYACDVCGRRFERQSLLNQHITWHHTDHGFSCNRCGMKFSEKFGLHIHESQEHNMRPMIPLMLPPPIPPLPPEQSMTSSMQSHVHHDPMPEIKPNMDIPIHISKEAFLKSRKKIQYCEDCREHFTSKYDLLRHRVTTGHMGGAGGVCLDREEATNTLSIDSLQRQKRLARMPRQGMPNPAQQSAHYPPILPKGEENPLGLPTHPTDLDSLAYRPGRKGRPRKNLPGTNRRMSVPNIMLSSGGSEGLRAYDFTDDSSDSLPVKPEPYETDYKDSRSNSPGSSGSSVRQEQKDSPNKDDEMIAYCADGHKVRMKYKSSSPEEMTDNI